MRKEYPISVCDRFIRGLNRRIIAGFQCMNPQHSNVHTLNGTYQHQQVAIILCAAQAAKNEVHQVQDIACGILGQGFLTNVVSVGAYPSQVEATQKYKTDMKGRGGGTKESLECWRCGGNHSWMKGGKFSCPWGNDPAVQAKAKEWYKAYKASSRGHRYKGRKGRVIKFKDMTKQQQKKLRKAVLAITAGDSTSSVTSAIMNLSNKSGTKSGPRVFLMVLVFSAALPPCRILPVPLQPLFPHITLVLGQDLNSSNCPVIHCIINTAVVLSTGNLHFFAIIAKAYPKTVAAIHTQADFLPIIFSGIVQQGGESVTTELMAAFHFHLPYLTREGSATSLLVVTGPNVIVNTILGLPFIQLTRMIINASDQVTELQALDTAPFLINYHQAMCTVPSVEPKANPAITSHADIIKKIEQIEQFYATDQHAAPSPPSILHPAKRARKVANNPPTSPAVGKVVSFGSIIELEPNYSVEAEPDELYKVPALPV